MISVLQNKNFYEIRFPYNEALVDFVKQVPGRRWNPKDKFWSIPKDKLGFFLNQIKGTSFESELSISSDENINISASIDNTSRNYIPDIDISDVRQYVKDGGHLFKHQLDCMKYSIGRKDKGNFNGFLLADEMGCVSGSSLVSININNIVNTDITIKHLFEMFESEEHFAHSNVKIKCFDDNHFEFYNIRCVLDKGTQKCLKIYLKDGRSLECTLDHEILTKCGWVEAQNLKTDDYVVCDLFNNDYHILHAYSHVQIDRVEAIADRHVYDIGVDHPVNHNFVCNGIVVHNCGKTLEVINLALFKKQYEEAKHCLIICCVNAAKYNWADDIALHTNGEYEGYILGSRIKKRTGRLDLNGSSKDKLQDLETGLMYSDEELNKPLPYFLILNIEALRHTDNDVKLKRDKYTLTNKIAELCNNREITMIALDEIHRNASPQSTQGKQILAIKKKTGRGVEWIPMTGTPVVNKPTDVFLPMRLVEAHNVDSYYKWNQHYCIYGGYGGYNIIGYKNIPELKSILEPNMLRRTKEQVLDLPGKIHHVEYVENTTVQKKLYDKIQAELLNDVEEIQQSLNPLAKLIRLRQVNGCPEVIDSSIDTNPTTYVSKNAKVRRLLELVQDITDNNEKVVVFSNWIEPLRTAYRCLKKHKFNVASYVGTMSQEEREQNKKNFIENPNCKVILGTVGALGTSHTLSVASNVIFLDEPWHAAALDQAEDRCYRLNSTKAVNIYSIITKDTVDEKVHDIIRRKRGTSDFIVDNELNVRNNPELLPYLLS